MANNARVWSVVPGQRKGRAGSMRLFVVVSSFSFAAFASAPVCPLATVIHAGLRFLLDFLKSSKGDF